MIDNKAVEAWYSGKALSIITSFVLPTLAQAERDGEWPPKASIKVKAALNKQNMAAKFARNNIKELNDINSDRKHPWSAKDRGWEISHAMEFGLIAAAENIASLVARLQPRAEDDAELGLLAVAEAWAAAFIPVSKLVKLLDSTRPKPVIILGTLSRLVVGNLQKAMGIAMETVEMPKIEYSWEVLNGARIAVGHLVWPDGTRHNQSKFSHGAGNHDQCHACGHAIKNAFNWIPLVAQTATGPVSLWVGRDCAKNLFNCDVKGEAEFKAARKVTQESK